MAKKNLLFAILCCCYSLNCSAQKKDNHGTDTKWYKGSIVLSDGTELLGIIRNNEKARLISYKENINQDGFESFRPTEILSLEYFDEDNSSNRKFYSLTTKNKTTSDEDVFLFEILKEYEHFAVLSLRDRTNVTHSREISIPMGIGGISSSLYVPPKTDVSQTEEIYFMNESGARELYMVIQHHNVDRGFFAYITDKGIVNDESLILQYVGPENWKKLFTYSESTKLRIINRRNLVSLFDYYETILGQ
ncbi:MAG: hypothetical protein ABI663_23590 [Chryseolinea sp.]